MTLFDLNNTSNNNNGNNNNNDNNKNNNNNNNNNIIIIIIIIILTINKTNITTAKTNRQLFISGIKLMAKIPNYHGCWSCQVLPNGVITFGSPHRVWWPSLTWAQYYREKYILAPFWHGTNYYYNEGKVSVILPNKF